MKFLAILILVSTAIANISAFSFNWHFGSSHKCHYTQCYVNPCDLSKCPAHPEAYCLMNNCNGCHAQWFVNGMPVPCV
ncbi:hypothetical protein SNEBB_005191 [Seison nebaliae]|nr:hypothetical protein SNEBB_005191 [Seison nebaliae]